MSFKASFYFLSHSPLYIHLNAAEQALCCVDTSSLANSNNAHQNPHQDHTAIMPPQELKVVIEVAFPRILRCYIATSSANITTSA